MKTFQMLNRIELIGRIGQAKVTPVGDKKNIRMSVVTEYAYKDKDGHYTIDTQWHNVTGFSDKCSCAPEELTKDDIVHVIGRLKTVKYITHDGADKTINEVIAQTIVKMSTPEHQLRTEQTA